MRSGGHHVGLGIARYHDVVARTTNGVPATPPTTAPPIHSEAGGSAALTGRREDLHAGRRGSLDAVEQ